MAAPVDSGQRHLAPTRQQVKGNYANIDQSKTANEATITQGNNSSSNFGQIVQKGNYNSNAAGAPGATFINQTDNSTGNAASIEQLEDENAAQITQKTNSSQNEAVIRQVSGNNDFSSIDQSNTSSLNTARIDQSGVNSGAFISQNDNSVENKARLIQTGDVNHAVIEQKTNSGGTGKGNVADLFQLGNGNGGTSIIQKRQQLQQQGVFESVRE